MEREDGCRAACTKCADHGKYFPRYFSRYFSTTHQNTRGIYSKSLVMLLSDYFYYFPLLSFLSCKIPRGLRRRVIPHRCFQIFLGPLCSAALVLAESLWADGGVGKTFWVPLPSIALPCLALADGAVGKWLHGANIASGL